MKKITLCNEDGKSLLGSDGHLFVSKNLKKAKQDASIYRQRYKLNFAWKFQHWTHFFFDNNPSQLFLIQ